MSMLPAVSPHRSRCCFDAGGLLGSGRVPPARGCVLRSPISMRARAMSAGPQERPQQFERQREDDGGILIRGHVGEGLEVAHLHRHRIGSHDLGGLPELVRSLELPLR